MISIASLTILITSNILSTIYAANQETVYYDTLIKSSNLGNYEFRVETHEVPSKEWLPIVDNSYFPYTVETFKTEVDNTAPSATYKAKAISKVDVVFAFGEMEQSQTMLDYMDDFESGLNSAGNFIDAYVEKVETSTIDVTDQDASQILENWEAWKQYPADPTTSWSYIQDDKSIQDNQYHCHRQGFVDRSLNIKGDFELSADIVGYGHSYNDFYGLTFRHQDDGSHYAVVWQDIQGSRCGMYRGQIYTGITLVKTGASASDGKMDDGITLATYSECGQWIPGQYWNLKVKMISNTIIVYLNDEMIIEYTDDNPYTVGNYGIVSVSHGAGRFKNITLTTGSSKSLGEAISDVSWRDNSIPIVVYGEDTLPEYLGNTNNADYQYTVSKLINSNIYLIVLGTSINKIQLTNLINNISIEGETKGKFIYNSPIINAMNSARDWIINKVKQNDKPVDYILVNTEVYWETLYNDYERDLPLNFGEHDGTKNSDTSDKELSTSWGVGLTHLYTQDKILAEKWRYRHNNTYYDNSPVIEAFSGIWLSDPIDIFPNPGKYYINYKRKDNPFYPDVLNSNIFDEYRKWSTNYD